MTYHAYSAKSNPIFFIIENWKNARLMSSYDETRQLKHIFTPQKTPGAK